MGILTPLLPQNSYLAGGTALALHLNHRSSYDLDIYSPDKFELQAIISQWSEALPNFKLIRSAWQTIIGTIEDIEISLFYYEPKLILPTTAFNSMKIASIEDLSCMKLEAIADRGLKRDFFDLYTICQLDGWNLSKVFELDNKKYQRDQTNWPHILKSLIYFDDAETKPERAKIVDNQWQQVKKYFEQEVPLVAKKILV